MGINVCFIHSPSFHKWSHSHVAWVFARTIAQHIKEGFTFSHTHTKKKEKEQLKLQTEKIVLRKPKEGKKENQQEKIKDKYELKKLQEKTRNKNIKRIKNNKNNKIWKKKKKKLEKQKFSNPQKIIKKPFQI